MLHATTLHGHPTKKTPGWCAKAAREQQQAGVSVLGIDDPVIWGVYLLCIFSALLCVIYGIVNWNREGELEAVEIQEEAVWEVEEEEMQKKELGQ
ncbi:MAG: hypothetical protein A4E48_02264 [Methanosaeta sp. PtaU1.Bin060]|jgi:hypothetical protein|nr:MAG: hypothetical protein A4E48_02264 [Methanosaeta sp. PtaU1.Bin060]